MEPGKNTIQPVEYYKNTLDKYDGQFSTTINTLSSAYVNKTLFPDNTEYQNVYNKKIKQVKKLETDLFVLQNELENAVDNDRNIGDKIKKNIDKAENKENELTNVFNIAEESGAAGAQKVLTDTYKLQYASNFFMVLGIIISVFTLFMLFKPENNTSI
jgi:hypothetical protein